MAAGSVSALLQKNDDPEAMLREVMSDFDLEILEKSPIEYRCYCSRDRMESALISLGPQQLQELIEEQAEAESHETYDYKEEGQASTGLGALLKGFKFN